MLRRAALAGLLVITPAAPAQTGSKFRTAKAGELGVVASESPAASRAARAMLERGGNAIDAAATGVFALGVARPQSCGIGGGGFLVYRSASGAARTLDFRETAPAAMRPDTFSSQPGGLHEKFTGHLTVGVPGTVAGMASALNRYGTVDLRDAIRPAEELARTGFAVPLSLAIATKDNAKRLSPEARRLFLRPDGTEHPPGTTFQQLELARSLRLLMRQGPRAMYGGELARRIVRDMRAPRPDTKDPGILTVKDFAAYEAKWRTPLRGTYRGRGIVAMPPPSSGGTTVLQMLKVLERFDLGAMGAGSADALHLLAEAQKIAFGDRNRYVADPDVVDVPVAQMLSGDYAAKRAAQISMQRAGGSSPGLGELPARPEESTTSLSVLDRDGNAVVVTCTIEQEFGSGVVAPGTGFLRNNELTDFGKPGTANEPRPGKRPRSSIAPTIVVEGGRRVLAVGGAGGARIIMGSLLPIVQMVDFDQQLDSALDAPRIDAMNGKDGAVALEDARLAPCVVYELRRRGHRLDLLGEYGRSPRVNAVGAVAVRPGVPPARAEGRFAASDPRTDDGALVERQRR